jgi:glyoxylase-like metal-dependent hydrolase (beta-lactamase superfamily II)
MGLPSLSFSNMSLGSLGLVDEKRRPTKPYGLIQPALANIAPPAGLKLWFLDLGDLAGDEGWNLRGKNARTAVDTAPTHKWRVYKQMAILIEHPEEGLILYECGSGKGDGGRMLSLFSCQRLMCLTAEDYVKLWGAMSDLFCRVNPDKAQELPDAIAKTGHDISEVRHVILGHLHLDHAGGLVHFRGRNDVKFHVHEAELKVRLVALRDLNELNKL